MRNLNKLILLFVSLNFLTYSCFGQKLNKYHDNEKKLDSFDWSGQVVNLQSYLDASSSHSMYILVFTFGDKMCHSKWCQLVYNVLQKYKNDKELIPKGIYIKEYQGPEIVKEAIIENQLFDKSPKIFIYCYKSSLIKPIDDLLETEFSTFSRDYEFYPLFKISDEQFVNLTENFKTIYNNQKSKKDNLYLNVNYFLLSKGLKNYTFNDNIGSLHSKEISFSSLTNSIKLYVSKPLFVNSHENHVLAVKTGISVSRTSGDLSDKQTKQIIRELDFDNQACDITYTCDDLSEKYTINRISVPFGFNYMFSVSKKVSIVPEIGLELNFLNTMSYHLTNGSTNKEGIVIEYGIPVNTESDGYYNNVDLTRSSFQLNKNFDLSVYYNFHVIFDIDSYWALSFGISQFRFSHKYIEDPYLLSENPNDYKSLINYLDKDISNPLGFNVGFVYKL